MRKKMEQSGRHILSGILSLSLAVSAFTGVAFMRKADAAEQVTVQGHALNKSGNSRRQYHAGRSEGYMGLRVLRQLSADRGESRRW